MPALKTAKQLTEETIKQHIVVKRFDEATEAAKQAWLNSVGDESTIATADDGWKHCSFELEDGNHLLLIVAPGHDDYQVDCVVDSWLLKRIKDTEDYYAVTDVR